MNIQWYPGHMHKTKKLIMENIKLVDIVIEILDARLPVSSQNPTIEEIVSRKPKLVVLNKSDLSDPKINEEWIDWFNANNTKSVLVNCQSGKGINKIPIIIEEVLKEEIERRKCKGIVSKSIKLMVIGIPNVGKSSFINRIAGKSSAKTGNRPGITKGKQWIKIKGGLELLDTPGILWPKFEDEKVGLKLAFSGAIKDEIIEDIEYLACLLLEFLKENYCSKLIQRYNIEDIKDLSGYEILQLIGRKRGCIISGNEVDTFRISNIILDEFRNGTIGRISLEKPGEFNTYE